MNGPRGHARETELYSESNRKTLKGFKQRIDTIIFIF